MQFDHTIDTRLTTQQLWNLLDEAFTDSTESPVWPNELERLESQGIREGERVTALYRAPITGLRIKQNYILRDVEEGRRFSYRVGRSHPLVGGGTVEFIETTGGSRLHWYGSYDVPARPDSLAAAAFVKFWFEGRFFEALEENLRSQTKRERAAS